MAKVYTIETETTITNPVLREKSVPVQKVDSRIKKMISKMVKTMKDSEGCGLAAPQIGENIQVMIGIIGKKTIAMVNPVILSHSTQTNFDDEGCLSIPGEYGKVERWNDIEVEFLDERGVKMRRKLSMFDARVVQHEIDHLNGVLFTDRMTPEHLAEMHAQKKEDCAL